MPLQLFKSKNHYLEQFLDCYTLPASGLFYFVSDFQTSMHSVSANMWIRAESN